MLSVQLEGDQDVDGRVILTPAQSKFTFAGKLVSINGTPMTTINKCSGQTANGSTKFTFGGVPVNLQGDIDTCGSPLNGSRNFTA